MLLITLVALGVLIDLLSCFLYLQRNRNPSGASGLPIVIMLIFYLLPLLLFEQSIFTTSLLVDGLLLISFHIFVVILIPRLDRRYLDLKLANK